MDENLKEAIKKAGILASELKDITDSTAKVLLNELKDGVDTYADLEVKLGQVRRAALWDAGRVDSVFLRSIFNQVDCLITKEKNGLQVIQQEGKHFSGEITEVPGCKDDIEVLEKRVAALEKAQERPEGSGGTKSINMGIKLTSEQLSSFLGLISKSLLSDQNRQ